MSTRQPHSRRRLFTVLMWCIPVAFFLLLESGLRVFGVGGSYPLFVQVPEAPDYLVMNQDMAKRYFAREVRVPTGLHDVFLAQKDSQTVRIFVQGGSSAAGYPYYYGGSFSRMLEQRLQQTWPRRRIEVVNTAVAAVNSYTMLDQVDEILDQSPDAVVIYAGHNEYYGALGAGSSESLGRYRSVINLCLSLRSWRTLQALRIMMARAGEVVRSPNERESTLMERMVGRQAIPYQSRVYDAGMRQWRGNLRAILKKYERRNVPVFMGTLASNERTHAPFISMPSEGTDVATWEAAYNVALEATELSAGIHAMEPVIAMDSIAAQPHFALGKMLDAAEMFDEARVAYRAAKDRDQLRFRASEEANAVVREEVKRSGATLVDTQAALTREARNGIIGSDLMLEHLHPNLEGYFVVADAFYEAIYTARLGGLEANYVPRAVARKEVLFTVVDSLFGTYRVRQLLSSWPFESMGTVLNRMDTVQARNSVEAIALDLYHGRAQWYEATDRLRAHYETSGDFHRALRATLAMIQQYPYLPRPYALAADIMMRQGRVQEAVVYFEAANDLEETGSVHYMLGTIHLRNGRLVKAGEHLGRAADLEPESVQILMQLAQYYVLVREWEQAETTAEQLLEVDPDHANARQLVAFIVQQSM